MKLTRKLITFAVILSATVLSDRAIACTGISLVSRDSSIVLARTCEWGGSYLDSR